MSARERFLLVVFILIVAGYLGYYYLVPVYQQYRSWGREIRVTRKRLLKSSRLISRIPRLENSVNKNRQLLSRFLNRTPSNREFLSLLKELEQAAHQAGLDDGNVVQLTRIRTPSSSSRGRIQTTIIRTRFVGASFEELVRLLWQVQNLHPLIGVSEFRMSVQERARPPTYRLKMTLRAHRPRRQAGEMAGTEEP